MDVQQVLTQRIQEFIAKNPVHNSKQIYVVDTATHVGNQLKQRLEQAKNGYSGERLVLIPYNLGNSHFTGIGIKFKEGNQLERAEYINPVEESKNIPDQLQEYFNEIFPGTHLQIRLFEHVGDRDLSASLVIKYLLVLVKEFIIPPYQTHEQSRSIISQAADANFEKASFSEGNHLTLSNAHTLQSPMEILETEGELDGKVNLSMLKKQLQERFDELDITNENELEQRIVEKKQRIEQLRNQGNHDSVRKREKSLNSLEEVELLINSIKEPESPLVSNDFQTLKTQIDTAFTERDIRDENHLKELTSDKKQRIENLKKEGKDNSVRLREKSLSELESLLSLVQKFHTLSRAESETSKSLVDDTPFDENISDSFDENEFPIKENLSNMKNDFEYMPSCSERSVISLLYHVSCQLVNNHITRDLDLDQIEIEINKEFANLSDRVKVEELSSSEICSSIQELSIHIKNKSWANCLSLLRKTLKEISPLNIHDLFRLVEKVDYAVEIIKDKDVIFFFGPTGSGKSTVIHFLAGSKMVATQIEGLYHIAATNFKNPDLQHVTSSPFARSETRCITSVTVKFEDLGILRPGSIVLCDTPGFEDTNGPEVDIANGISIVRAIRQCKTVKPVVLVSYKSIGDRFEGLKSLIHLLARLIPGIQDQIKAFSYIFTKYPSSERTTIHASLKAIANTMTDQEKSDTSFMNLFQDMLLKTKRHTLALDPLRDDPQDFLHELVTSIPIQYPDEVFQFSITEKSKSIVQEQVRKYELSVISAIKRSEYPLIKYYLDQMKCLNKLLEQDFIELIYSNCIRRLTKHLSEEYQEGTSKLSRSLMHQIIITDSDIKQYQTYINHAESAEQLRKDHLSDEVVHGSAFIQYLNQQINEICRELREKEMNDSSVKTGLDKIQILTQHFPEIEETYQSICQLFTEKLDVKVHSFENLFHTNEFDQCATILTNLSDALNIFHRHLDEECIKRKYFKLREDILNYFSNSIKNLDYLFKQTKLEMTDVDQINTCLVMLDTALTTSNLEIHIPKQDIKQMYDSFLLKILNFFESIIREIHTELKKQNGLENLEKLIEQLELIRTIKSIALETSQVYFATLEKLFGYIYQLRRDAEEFLRVLCQGGECIDFEKLVQCLSTLKSAIWIEKYRTGLYSSVISDVEQLIFQHVEKLKNAIMSTNLDLGHFHQIEHVAKQLSDLNEMKHFENFLPPIKEHIEEANSWFQTITNNVFDHIQSTYNFERRNEQEYKSLDSIKAEKAFCYLNACKDASIRNRKVCLTVLENLETFVRKFSQLIQNEMESCFDIIKKSPNTNEILDNVRILSSRMQEISDIEKATPHVFAHFSKSTIIQDWQTELSNYYLALSTEMARLNVTQQTEAFNTKLTTAKALSKLDKFLESSKFIDIYNEYQKILFSQNNDIGQQVIDAIKNFDYEGVAV